MDYNGRRDGPGPQYDGREPWMDFRGGRGGDGQHRPNGFGPGAGGPGNWDPSWGRPPFNGGEPFQYGPGGPGAPLPMNRGGERFNRGSR